MDFCYYSHSVCACHSFFTLSSSVSCAVLAALWTALSLYHVSSFLFSSYHLSPLYHSLLLFDNETLNFLPAAHSLLGTHTQHAYAACARAIVFGSESALRVLITPLPLCVLCETSISIFILDYLLAGLRSGRERGHGQSSDAGRSSGSACSGFHSVFDADSVAAGTRIFCRTKLLHWQTQTFY